MRRGAAGALALALLVGCQSRPLLPASSAAPPELRKACSLAEQKCSRCHGLDRIRLASWQIVDWDLYVGRMRRQPGSGISVGDATIILRCLEHLQQLQRAQRDDDLAPAGAAP